MKFMNIDYYRRGDERVMKFRIKPTNSTRRSIAWCYNNFPIRIFKKHLIATRINRQLSMKEINLIVEAIRNKTFETETVSYLPGVVFIKIVVTI